MKSYALCGYQIKQLTVTPVHSLCQGYFCADFLANNERPIIHLILTTEGSGSIEPIVSPLSIDFFLLTLEDLDRLGSYVFFRTVLEKGLAYFQFFLPESLFVGAHVRISVLELHPTFLYMLFS